MACMGPTLNLLSAAGIIKGLTVILTMVGIPTDSGIYMLANAAGDALFFGLPVMLGFNVAKYLKIDPYFGFLFGAALTYPAIQGVDLNFELFKINATYTSSFLPVLFGLLVAAPLWKFFNKRLPNAIKGFLTPLLTLIIAFPLTFILIGPIANAIGTGIAVGMDFLFVKTPFFAYVILGLLWQVLVMFGVHGILAMFAFYSLLEGNPSALLAATGGAPWGIVGITLALSLFAKNDNLKRTSAPSLASAVMGVTEPAMYGIIVPRKILLLISCLAGGLGGLIAAIFSMKAYTFTGMGPMALLGSINPDDPQILPIVLIVVVPLVAGFLLTKVLYKETDDTKVQNNISDKSTGVEKHGASNRVISIQAPVTGVVKSLIESSDEVFASEALGKGVVIVPSSDTVFALISGTVKTVFPTGHAIGIVGENGEEVLIHVGINTVNLQGKYFSPKVSQGDTVHTGEVLVEFDRKAIEQMGYNTEVMMIVTNSDDFLDVIPFETENATLDTTVIKVLKGDK